MLQHPLFAAQRPLFVGDGQGGPDNRVRSDRAEAVGTQTKRRIVAVVPADQRERLQRSILGRGRFELVYFKNPLQAIRTLVSQTPELLFVYDSGFGVETLHLIERLFQKIPFSIIVLSEFSGESYPKIVTEIIPADFDLDDFNRRIGKILDLPTRITQRFLVRIVCEVSANGRCGTPILANTVDLSEEGMLLQCHRELEIGSVCSVQFLGFDHLALPAFSLRIVRAEDSQIRGARPDRFAGVFIGKGAVRIREIFDTLVC